MGARADQDLRYTWERRDGRPQRLLRPDIQLRSRLIIRQTRASPCLAASGWRRSRSSITTLTRSSGDIAISSRALDSSASLKVEKIRTFFSTATLYVARSLQLR